MMKGPHEKRKKQPGTGGQGKWKKKGVRGEGKHLKVLHLIVAIVDGLRPIVPAERL